MFGPFVRRELLKWDMFASPRLDDMEWLKVLFDYGLNAPSMEHVAGIEEHDHEQVLYSIIGRISASVHLLWDFIPFGFGLLTRCNDFRVCTRNNY